MSEPEIHVVKLGGSLLDLPDFVARFEAWQRTALGARGVLIVGGGAAADVVRRFDEVFHLREEEAHWLAVRAMALNAHAVAAVVEGAVVVAKPRAAEEAWVKGRMAVVEPWEWLTRDAAEGTHVPHRWTFTSDSIAAHVATRLGAAKLTLLKSALPAVGDCGLACAAGLGIVDEDFPEAAKSVPSIELVNLRTTPVGRCVLR